MSLSSMLPGFAAAPASFSQETRLLRIHTPLGADALTVERFQGDERVGEGGFRFEATLLSTDAHIELKRLIGQPVLVELLTQQSRDAYRPFHGHVTACELLGSDGGLARYRVVLEPWLAFLGRRRDSWIYQDARTIDIIDELLGDWSGQGKLAPLWRWELADESIYRRHSLVTQYDETDLAFFERLLADEGLFYWFEHEGRPEAEPFGLHRLVIADHAAAWRPGSQATVRFTQAGSTLPEDAIQRVTQERRIDSQSIGLASWDYRSLGLRPAEAQVPAPGGIDLDLSLQDTPGAYAWPDAATAQRIAARQLEALDARSRCLRLAGTLRSAATGTVIALEGHPRLGATNGSVPAEVRLALVAVNHDARNNLHADRKAGLAGLFAADPQGEDKDVPLYRQEALAVPAEHCWRPLRSDGRGVLLHPKPHIVGNQTAVVVGDAGQSLTADRDHRVKVQFHWVRGERSHGRLGHASGQDNAPADAGSGTWVRILTPQAGANWGGHFVPRIGQEVAVAFLEGDIDRPVVVGAVYNGRGQADAQHNRQSGQVGASTANAPAWFPGGTEGHAHNAVLHGLKTQALGTSQSGAGGYNQLVFDATPDEARAELATTQAQTRLQLGRLKHQPDNRRLADRGHGFDLATDAHGALRAGAGLLLSADARANAASTQLDAREAQAQLEQARQLATTLADSAQKQGARLDADPAAEQLPPLKGAAALHTALAGRDRRGGNAAAGDDGPIRATRGGEGEVPAWSAPLLTLSAPAGLVCHSPAEAQFASQTQAGLTAGLALDLIAQASLRLAVKDGLVLYTHGQAPAGRPVADSGLKLHAASGKVTSQSQSAATRLAAQQDVTLASTTKSLAASAPNHLLLTAAGAYLKLEGGNIEVHGPGSVTFHAGQKNLAGPASVGSDGLSLPKAKDLFDEQFVLRDKLTGQPMAGAPYRIVSGKGDVLLSGLTDEHGRTGRLTFGKPEDLRVLWGH